MKIFCLVGMKNGDLCAVLPILYHEHKATKQRVQALVPPAYTEIFSGCSYVNVLSWHGDWQDLRGAMTLAKQLCPDVVTPSTHGKGWALQKECPSFTLDQWKRGGELEHFDEWPLVFDKRDKKREAELIKKFSDGRPLILLGDKSESSPFNSIEDLAALLDEHFGATHQILRLSAVRAEKIYDLCGLYDKAVCLVSTETVHLHLSAASGVPVVALATDKPELWHGTAYQNRFVIHCRYVDYDWRKPQIIKAIQDAIALRSGPEIKLTGTAFERGYNPSIIDWNGKTLTTYRYHPDPTHWRTQLALHDGTTTFKIQPPMQYKDYSIEDGRLFVFKEKLHISYTVGRTSGNSHRCVMQYGELVPAGDVWKIVNQHQPIYGNNDFSGMEKNWVFFGASDRLFAIYTRHPEQIVLQIENEKVVNEYKTKMPPCNYGTPRGGTQPLPYHGGLWLQFFHSNLANPKSAQWWNYHVGALLMDSKPPFAVKQIGTAPVLTGNEKYFPNWKFWKSKVFIAYGAVLRDGDYLISIGYNDSACAVARVKPEHLNL